MENKKTKAKNYYQANKEKLQERSWKYYKTFSHDEKLKKDVMLTREIKICQMKIDKEKKNIWKLSL